jgi:hypothetical protein
MAHCGLGIVSVSMLGPGRSAQRISKPTMNDPFTSFTLSPGRVEFLMMDAGEVHASCPQQEWGTGGHRDAR